MYKVVRTFTFQEGVTLEQEILKGVAVSHISKYCTQEVADYAVGMMLKIGLLGFGNIPRLITQRLKPFGPKIIAYDPYVSPQTAAEMGVDLVSMEEVLSTADIVSIHLPLNDETTKIMNKDRFDLLKGNTIFINSARGSLVDENAVLEALNSGKIRYYAADVLEAEFPDVTNQPFIGRDDIILTPHIAWFSQESVRDGRIEAAQNVLHFLNGEYDKAQIINGVRPDNK